MDVSTVMWVLFRLELLGFWVLSVKIHNLVHTFLQTNTVDIDNYNRSDIFFWLFGPPVLLEGPLRFSLSRSLYVGKKL